MSENVNQIDIREYLSVLKRRKAFVIIPLMIIPLVAFVIGFFMPPVYSSSVTLMIGESKVLPPSVERQLDPGRSFSRETIEERQRILYGQITSTQAIRRLIAILNIQIPHEIREVVTRTKSAYPEISENELAETILADRLRNNISISLSSTNLVQIEFDAADPIQAQMRAKTLADIF